MQKLGAGRGLDGIGIPGAGVVRDSVGLGRSCRKGLVLNDPSFRFHSGDQTEEA